MPVVLNVDLSELRDDLPFYINTYMPVVLNVDLSELRDDLMPPEMQLIADDWKDTLTFKRTKVYDNLKRKIPDEAHYIDYLAVPSYTNWYGFVNPSWPKFKKATLKQKFGVLGGASYFLTNVYYAIGLDYRFSEGVSKNVDKFRGRVYEIWKLTGDNDKVIGPLQKLQMALTGNIAKLKKAIIEGLDVIDMLVEPVPPMFAPEVLNMCVSAVIQKATETYRMAKLVMQAGEDPTPYFTEFVTFCDNLITTFPHPNVDPENSSIAMMYDETAKLIYIEVVINTI